MMRTLPSHSPLALAAWLLLASIAAPQDTFTEGFEGGSNVGGWSWGTGNASISPLNGHPGAFLQDLTLFTAQPILRTAPQGPSTPFTGDFRARGVTSIGVDLVTLDKQFAVEGNRWLTLVLLDNNGTPGNPNDDSGAYFVSDKLVPSAGVIGLQPAGWTPFDFEVDSQADALPPGWHPITFGPTPPAWPQLMAGVDSVQFWYGAPGTIFLFDSWDVGADNVRITSGICQQDLGFGGPGNIGIAACGAPLATGGTAELTLEGAPASSPVFLVVGLAGSPTAFKGGTLVPSPILLTVVVASDAAGTFSSLVPGGGGPFSVVLQAVSPDGSLPGGFALSNALQLAFLP